MPIPNATVATTTLNFPFGLQNPAKMVFFIVFCVQLLNMSTNLNRARSGAPMGSMDSFPKYLFKYI